MTPTELVELALAEYKRLNEEAIAAMGACKTLQELDIVQAKYFGKKSERKELERAILEACRPDKAEK